jgi:hypothetical protein
MAGLPEAGVGNRWRWKVGATAPLKGRHLEEEEGEGEREEGKKEAK